MACVSTPQLADQVLFRGTRRCLETPLEAALAPWHVSSTYSLFSSVLRERRVLVFLALFEPLPLNGAQPRWVRVQRYRYSYAPWAERRGGVWWRRELLDTFVPPTRLLDGRLCVAK